MPGALEVGGHGRRQASIRVLPCEFGTCAHCRALQHWQCADAAWTGGQEPPEVPELQTISTVCSEDIHRVGSRKGKGQEENLLSFYLKSPVFFQGSAWDA